MQPPDETRLSEAQDLGAWRRLTLWVSLNRPLAWLVSLTFGLVLFLVWLPAYVRMFFWHGLQGHAVLAGMTLGFSLLTVSLLWSTGQRLDSWTFLVLNVRGRHPRWLDRLMWGFTQIGNGIVSGVLALILFFNGHHLPAYELILGTITLWLVVELVKALVHRGTTFHPPDPDAHRRQSSPWALVPERAHQPGLLPGDADSRVLPRGRLGGVPALRYRAGRGHHADLRRGALPARRAGGGHPWRRLGPAGGNRLRVCIGVKGPDGNGARRGEGRSDRYAESWTHGPSEQQQSLKDGLRTGDLATCQTLGRRP